MKGRGCRSCKSPYPGPSRQLGACPQRSGARHDGRGADRAVPARRPLGGMGLAKLAVPRGHRRPCRESAPRSSAKSLWYQNVPETQGVRPIFQMAFFKTTFASSSPTCPATQSVSRRCPGWREIDRLGEPSEHGKRLRPPRGFIFSLVDPLRSKVAALRGTALCLQSPRSRSA